MNEILTRDLFGNCLEVKTFGIKYAGSKQKIIPYLLNEISKLDVKTIFDGFSGTTRVSQALALNGYNVISNDIAIWSEIFAKAFLLPRDNHVVSEMIDHLNALKPVEGWFTENYGGQKHEEKKIWQIKNTKKLDAIRQEIDRLKLDDVTKSVALTALILGLDKVDSSLGHFTSYLRKWSARSYNDLQLKVPPYQGNALQHKVMREDILKIDDASICADLAYLDPPYGSNNEKMPPSRVRYTSYYHLWTSIIKNDKPKLFGAASRREDTRDGISISPFEEFRKNEAGQYIALSAIDDMLHRVNAKYIVLSYSSGGRATATELNEAMKRYGEIINTIIIDYRKHIMASMSWTNEWIVESSEPHKEFIFVLAKK